MKILVQGKLAFSTENLSDYAGLKVQGVVSVVQCHSAPAQAPAPDEEAPEVVTEVSDVNTCGISVLILRPRSTSKDDMLEALDDVLKALPAGLVLVCGSPEVAVNVLAAYLMLHGSRGADKTYCKACRSKKLEEKVQEPLCGVECVTSNRPSAITPHQRTLIRSIGGGSEHDAGLIQAFNAFLKAQKRRRDAIITIWGCSEEARDLFLFQLTSDAGGALSVWKDDTFSKVEELSVLMRLLQATNILVCYQQSRVSATVICENTWFITENRNFESEETISDILKMVREGSEDELWSMALQLHTPFIVEYLVNDVKKPEFHQVNEKDRLIPHRLLSVASVRSIQVLTKGELMYLAKSTQSFKSNLCAQDLLLAIETISGVPQQSRRDMLPERMVIHQNCDWEGPQESLLTLPGLGDALDTLFSHVRFPNPSARYCCHCEVALLLLLSRSLFRMTDVNISIRLACCFLCDIIINYLERAWNIKIKRVELGSGNLCGGTGFPRLENGDVSLQVMLYVYDHQLKKKGLFFKANAKL